MGLYLNNRKLDVTRLVRRPTVERAQAIAKRLPANCVYTTREFARLLGISVASLQRYQIPGVCWHQYGRKVYWGCDRAIKAFIKELTNDRG